MGKAAAKTAVFKGVSKQHFQEDYYPVYKSIIIDNWFGKRLYTIIDVYKNHKILTKWMLAIVKDEQQSPNNPKRLSSVLWDIFTGNERYKNIFHTAVSLPMHSNIWREFAKILIRREL
jgi:hypothetical protein